MTTTWKVLAVLVLTLPVAAYVAGKVVGPPEYAAAQRDGSGAATSPGSIEPRHSSREAQTAETSAEQTEDLTAAAPRRADGRAERRDHGPRGRALGHAKQQHRQHEKGSGWGSAKTAGRNIARSKTDKPSHSKGKGSSGHP